MNRRQKDLTRASALLIILPVALLVFSAILFASTFKAVPLRRPESAIIGTSAAMSQHLAAANASQFAKLPPNLPQISQPRVLSLADRIAYQHVIEEVYWRHRIWPKENSGSKPSLDEVMSSAQIERKVKDYLRNSQLLSHQWQRPITAEQLQAEMERMASQTKQPEVLQELFTALGNDPGLVAECLARPILSERLVRELYAHDENVHGALKRRAENELRSLQKVEEMKRTSGVCSEMEWIRSDTGDSASGTDAGTIRMTTGEWEDRIKELAIQFQGPETIGELSLSPEQRSAEGTAMLRHADPNKSNDFEKTLAEIRTSALSRLQEDDSGYYATALLEKGRDRLRIATITWQKEPFESWTSRAQNEPRETPIEPIPDYTLPQVAISSAGCTPDSWTATKGVPEGRSLHTAVWTGSEMIVWGGYNGSSYFNSGGRYSPSTDSWVATSSDSAPTARESHTAIWTGSEMIVWGGRNGSTFFNSGGRYNPSTDSWVPTSTNGAPTGRSYHTAVWTGSEMIVWGGFFNGSVFNSGGRYNPGMDSWLTTGLSGAPTARNFHTAVWTGSEMIVWGGSNNNGVLNSGGRYNPSTDSWVATNTTGAPEARGDHTAVWTGGEMIIWSGFTGSAFNHGGRYNPSTDSWVVTNTTGEPIVRTGHTAVWIGAEMIIWGGQDRGGNYLNDGGRYNPSTDNWVATNTIGAPTARGDHTVVWTGSEMIVWGGTATSVGKVSNSGGRYNPSMDSWVVTSQSGVPAARAGHTAVWTGSEVIIWGGFDGSSHFNSGGRYNPSTDSWVATSFGAAPDARANHRAVWTGSEMIVWGGDVFGNFLNSGGRYNPSTDSWVATSNSGAPTARSEHTAVWTGGEMIVWGGDNGSFFNSGGRYNPSTDSWVATSSSGAPAPRGGHTAVWTDSEMIVWGGSDFGNFFNSGGRYNPGTDSWLPISTNGTPTGRSYHTAVWTGSEMIVWGGDDFDGNSFNDGGRYNPSMDNWLATNATGAPAPRYVHTAVWTDSEMIVWGGKAGSDNYFNDGGRYNPTTNNWLATNTTGAPAARASHTAVWTGGEMIIWGGFDGHNDVHNYLNTGGRYCFTTTPGPSPTPTPSVSPTPTAAPSSTQTPSVSPTPTAAPSSTPTPTLSPTPTATPTPPSTPTPSPTSTPSPSAAPAAQALNLSTRMRVLTNSNVGIGGFIVTGTAPKMVLLRAIGPSLGNFGVPDPLADPVMELDGSGGFVTLTNDNWKETQQSVIKATGLAPTDDLESAILVTLPPGNYTAIVQGTNNGVGVGLVEAYDLGQTASSKLANISTRAFVGTGTEIMITGFILGGNTGDDDMILRGIGPSLSQFGVPDALPDPTLELHDTNGALLRANDNWQDDPTQAALISAAGLAPTDALESAIAATLPPGQYTVLLAGKDNGTGVGLAEAYDLGGGAAPVPKADAGK